MRVREWLKSFGAMEMMFNVRKLIRDVKRELHERNVVPTGIHRPETWVMRMDKRHKLGSVDGGMRKLGTKLM